MTYQYRCSQCEHTFDVIKSVKDIEVNETCPKCDEFARREFVPKRVFFNGTKVEHPEYNPGLGCIVRNKSHRKELCKIKGVEEVGSEPVESLHKHHEKTRQDQWEKSWDKVTEGWVGNGDIGG